jgi:hypothetical protein
LPFYAHSTWAALSDVLLASLLVLDVSDVLLAALLEVGVSGSLWDVLLAV